jgi:hypothetical protein
MHADVNIADGTDGRTPLGALFNNPELGTYLMKQGADMFLRDNQGESILEMCMEYDEYWILQAFQDIEGERKIITDQVKLREYVIALILGGFASRASLFLDETGEQQVVDSGFVYLGPDKATVLLAKMSGSLNGNCNHMHEPVETFELLVRCGAELDIK